MRLFSAYNNKCRSEVNYSGILFAVSIPLVEVNRLLALLGLWRGAFTVHGSAVSGGRYNTVIPYGR